MSSRSLHKALSRRQNRHLDSSRSEPNSDFNVIKSVLVIKADFNVNLAKDWSNTWVMTNSLLPFKWFSSPKRAISIFRFLKNHTLNSNLENDYFVNGPWYGQTDTGNLVFGLFLPKKLYFLALGLSSWNSLPQQMIPKYAFKALFLTCVWQCFRVSEVC